MRNRPLIFLLTITAFGIAGLSYSQEPDDAVAEDAVADDAVAEDAVAVVEPTEAVVEPPSMEQTYQELLETVATQIENLHENVNDTDSDNRENIKGTVLSRDLVTFSDIPGEVNRQIAVQQEAIARLIDAVARDYQNTRSTGTISVSQGGIAYDEDLPGEQIATIEEIQEAGNANDRTILTMYFTIEIFADVNRDLIAQALAATNPQDRRRLYQLQAALVYEVGTIATDILKELGLEGTETLERIKNENQAEVTSRMAAINSQIQRIQTQVDDGLVTSEAGSSLERSLMGVMDANEEIMDQWESLVVKANEQASFLNTLPTHIANIENNMELARLQLETLRDVGIISIALETMVAMEGMALTFSEMPLLELDRGTVLGLLGFSPTESSLESPQ